MSLLRVIRGEATCEIHGLYTYTAHQCGKSIVGKVCPKCLTEGQQRAAMLNEASEARERAQRQQKRLRDAGIPEIFLGASFDNYKRINEKAARNVDIVEAYAGEFKEVLDTRTAPGMIFTGTQGTGKTHLGAALISKLISVGYSAMYASVPALLVQLKEGVRGDFDNSVSLQIRRLSTPHLLVLDEYGAHTFLELDYQLLFQILDARYQKNLPTVLISNVHADVIKSELDKRFLERVQGSGGPILKFDWQSWRDPKAAMGGAR